MINITCYFNELNGRLRLHKDYMEAVAAVRGIPIILLALVPHKMIVRFWISVTG